MGQGTFPFLEAQIAVRDSGIPLAKIFVEQMLCSGNPMDILGNIEEVVKARGVEKPTTLSAQEFREVEACWKKTKAALDAAQGKRNKYFKSVASYEKALEENRKQLQE
eukprot:4261053-Lingulodinium_polyedra.AAC.1